MAIVLLIEIRKLQTDAFNEYGALHGERGHVELKLFKFLIDVGVERERMLFVLKSNLDVAPRHCIDRYDVFALLVDAVPSSSKMECMMRLNFEPFHILAVFGITLEDAVTCWTLLVKVEYESLFSDSAGRIQLKRQVRYYCVSLGD